MVLSLGSVWWEMKRIVHRVLVLYSLCFFLLPLTCEAADAAKPVIALQPLGNCLAKDIEQAKNGILALYDCEVKVVPTVALPQKAYYEPRSRYRADQLLHFLAVDVKLGFECVKVVGLTAKDISFTKGEVYDWGIFGLGSLDGKTCVISTFRLGAGNADTTVKTQRLIKVINHEIGHTFGLEHCPANGCLMQDAQGLIKTVDGANDSFCEKCHKRLEKVLRVK
jgi:archaemetzincin